MKLTNSNLISVLQFANKKFEKCMYCYAFCRLMWLLRRFSNPHLMYSIEFEANIIIKKYDLKIED
jgi:hypothetical protein